MYIQIRKLSDKWKDVMKKIISLLLVLAVMTIGMPMTFAAEDQEQTIEQTIEGSVQKDHTKARKITDVISLEAIIFVSAAALGFLAMASSDNGGGTTPTHE
jgi:Tfp pilus assembly protein PilO